MTDKNQDNGGVTFSGPKLTMREYRQTSDGKNSFSEFDYPEKWPRSKLYHDKGARELNETTKKNFQAWRDAYSQLKEATPSKMRCSLAQRTSEEGYNQDSSYDPELDEETKTKPSDQPPETEVVSALDLLKKNLIIHQEVKTKKNYVNQEPAEGKGQTSYYWSESITTESEKSVSSLDTHDVLEKFMKKQRKENDRIEQSLKSIRESLRYIAQDSSRHKDSFSEYPKRLEVLAKELKKQTVPRKPAAVTISVKPYYEDFSYEKRPKEVRNDESYQQEKSDYDYKTSVDSINKDVAKRLNSLKEANKRHSKKQKSKQQHVSQINVTKEIMERTSDGYKEAKRSEREKKKQRFNEMRRNFQVGQKVSVQHTDASKNHEDESRIVVGAVRREINRILEEQKRKSI